MGDAGAFSYEKISGGVIDPVSLTERATPSNPAQDTVTVFARANGVMIDIVARSSQGEECVICSLSDQTVAIAGILTLNWVE